MRPVITLLILLVPFLLGLIGVNPFLIVSGFVAMICLLAALVAIAEQAGL